MSHSASLLSPPDGDAVVSYFHQFADSPDGQRVVFTVFDSPESMQVVVMDLRNGAMTRIASVAGQNRHTGAHPLWISDHALIYCSGADYKIYYHDLRTGKIVAFDGGHISDYSSVNRKILYKNNDPSKEPVGIYEIDLNTGIRRRLICLSEVAKLKSEIGTENSVRYWRLDHPYWSPDGDKILFQVKTSSGKSNARDDYIFFADARAEQIHFIGNKPMHVQWWDNESVFGHDWQEAKDYHMRRWNLDGELIEELSGPGCHGTVSPDRQWIVTESWYRSDPINVYLYRRGEVVPRKQIFSQPAVVQGKSFWDIRSHVHPTFSRDGKRVFFNGQGVDGQSKVWVFELLGSGQY